jgi:hypothetical protein
VDRVAVARDASIGSLLVSRMSWTCGALGLSFALVASGLESPTAARAQSPAAAARLPAAPGFVVEVAVTGLPRPTQLAFAADGTLIVLGHGASAASAEITWLPPGAAAPVDGTRARRLVVPFTGRARQAVLGSLAADAGSGDLFLGEENGNRVYRLRRDAHQIVPAAVGLHHLVGGSGLAVDARGRLVILDFVSPETQLRLEAPPPLAIFDWRAPEGYQGPLVFRLDPADPAPLPRRLDLVAPFFPRAWLRRTTDGSLPRFIAVTALPNHDLVLLSSLGELFRLTENGELSMWMRLPAGHYHRISMAAAPDGSVVLTTGFHLREILRVAADGQVSLLVRDLGDPGGLAFDEAGRLYVAETALHRIIRLTPVR